jgi:hypothetical protein
MDYSIHINKYKYGQEQREPLLDSNKHPDNKNDAADVREEILTKSIG